MVSEEITHRIICVNAGSSTANAAEVKRLIAQGEGDKIYVLCADSVEAISMERLAEMAMNGLEDKYYVNPQEFVKIATCHLNPAEVLDKMIAVCHQLCNMGNVDHKKKTAQLIYYWLTKHPDDFSSAGAAEKLQKLCKLISTDDNVVSIPSRYLVQEFDPHASEKLGVKFKQLLGLESRDVALNILNYIMEDGSGWRNMRRISKSFKTFAEELIPFRNKELIGRLIKKKIQPKTAKLIDLDANIVAMQLTHAQLKVRKSIHPSEMIDLKWMGVYSPVEATNLITTIQQFNLSSKWIIYLILSPNSHEERKKALVWVLDLAKEMLELKNFEAITFIQSALSSSSIFRLNVLNDDLPKNSQKIKKNIEELTNVSHGWKMFRRLCAEERYCLPYIGIPLSDLKAISEGNPNNYTGTGLVDLPLFNIRSGPMEMVLRKHDSMPDYDPIPSIQCMLREEINSSRLQITENEMWKRSLEIQPVVT